MTKFLRPSHWSRLLGRKAETTESSTLAPAARPTPAASREVAAASQREAEEVDGDLDLNPIIERHAYFLWRNDGCPGGRDIYYWHRAEEEVRLAAAEGTLVNL